MRPQEENKGKIHFIQPVAFFSLADKIHAQVRIGHFCFMLNDGQLLKGKQPHELWRGKCELCRFIIFRACSLALSTSSVCCCRATALSSSAFL